MNQRITRWAGVALALAAAILYLATLDNGLRPEELAGGDLITHQYAQVQGRPSNAPGYPLYTMGGWLWFHGLRSLLGDSSNPVPVLSAYSTLWALLALALLYRLLVVLTGNWLVAFLLGAFYAVSYFFWYYAVSTEQYASAVAQTLAIVLLALRWDRLQNQADEAGDARPAGDGLLLALALLAGLTLAHMVTVALIIPPLLWFILSRRPGLLRRGRLVAAAVALALLPLLSYSFIYLRGAQYPEWRGAGEWPSAWAWFLDFVSTGQGREELTWSLTPLVTHEFPRLIWQELTWVVLLGGVAGLFLLGRRRGLFFASTLLLYALFVFIDRLGNWFQVIMPAYPLLIASFAVLVQAIWQRGDAPGRPAGQRAALHALLVIGLLALVMVRFERSWPQANLRDQPEDTALLPGRAILADEPAPGAAVFGVVDEALSLRYLTEIWGLRPDVTAVSSPQARDGLAAGRPLYVTDRAAPLVWLEIDPAASFSSAGQTLIRVTQQPAADLPADAWPLSIAVGDGLTLLGLDASPATPGQPWPVRLYWRAHAAIGFDWSVSLRPTVDGQPLRDAAGDIVLQDLKHPVHGAYPTSRWRAGEVVADDYRLTLPPGRAPNGLQVVVYRALPEGGFENLATLEVPLPPTSDAN